MRLERIKSLWLNKKKAIVISVIALAIIILALFLIYSFVIGDRDEDEIEQENYTVSTVNMRQTMTAAGQVTAGKTQTINLQEGKVFKASQVEKNEIVSRGQPLLYYTDGTHVDAPGAAIVSRVSVPKSGETTSSSDCVKYSSISQLYLKILIPEDMINSISKGNEASVVVNSEPDKEFSGRIINMKSISTSQMSNEDGEESVGEAFEGESASAYYAVNIEFTNDGNIKPGMSANSTIVISNRDDVLAVPIEAVYFDEKDRAYVNKVAGKKTEKILVETGESDAMNVEILKGLSEGDTIIVEKRR